MRSAVCLLLLTLLVLVGGCLPDGREPGEELCEALTADLPVAVAGVGDPPEVDDVDTLRPGVCATTTTRRFKVTFPGGNRQTRTTIRGRVAVDIPFSGGLAKLRAAYADGGGTRISDLSGLGPGAMLITTEKEPASDPSAGSVSPVGPVDGQPDLPVKAYWQRGGVQFMVSGTRDGASLQEQREITTRLARLINRRPATPETR